MYSSYFSIAAATHGNLQQCGLDYNILQVLDIDEGFKCINAILLENML